MHRIWCDMRHQHSTSYHRIVKSGRSALNNPRHYNQILNKFEQILKKLSNFAAK